jgi:hypothetical protein
MERRSLQEEFQGLKIDSESDLARLKRVLPQSAATLTRRPLGSLQGEFDIEEPRAGPVQIGDFQGKRGET